MHRKATTAILACAAAMTANALVARATSVYSDDFNRSTLDGTYTYSVGSFSWLAGSGSFADGGASVINDDILQLTNDATEVWNYQGIVWASTPTSAFSSPFNSTLNLNDSQQLTWTLNMRQIRDNPSGFTSNTYGVGFILGGSDASFNNAGEGYAVIQGQSGATDPLTLVHYTGGLTGTRTVIASLGDAANEFYSVKVTYDETGDTWSLYTRNDGLSAFSDPLNDAGYVLSGSAINSTSAGVSLGYLGAYWNFAGSPGQTALFDNFNLDVAAATGPTNPRDLTWNGSSGNWETTDNWLDLATPATWDNAGPDNAIFSNGSLPATVNLGTGASVGSMVFQATAPVHTLTGSPLSISGGITADQSVNINVPVTVGAPQTWSVASGKVMSLGAALVSGASIVKDGAGTVELTVAAPGFTGGMTLNAGAVKVSGASDANYTGAIGNGTVTLNGSSILELDNVNLGTFSGTSAPTVILKDTSRIKASGSSWLIRSGSPTVATASGTDVTLEVTPGGTLTIGASVRNDANGVNDSPAVIHIAGGGRVALVSGPTSFSATANHFTGSWVVDDGVLQVGPTGSAGEALNALGYNYGTLALVTQARPVTINSGGTFAAGIDASYFQNTGTFEFTTYRNTFNLNGGAIAGVGASPAFSGPINVGAGATSTILLTDLDDGVSPRDVTLKNFSHFDTVTSTTMVTPGDVTWGSNSTLVVSGNGQLHVNRDATMGVVSVGTDATLQINAGATVNLGGTMDALSDGVNHVNVVNNSVSSLNVTAGAKNVGGISGVGKTTVADTTSLTANHVRQSTLDIQGSGVVNIRAGGSPNQPAGTSVVNTLTLGATAQLDLTNNSMVIDYAGAVGTLEDDVRQHLQNGRITSSSAGGGTKLGYGDNAVLNKSELAGQTVDADSILIKFTYAGDANLDGQVTISDLGDLASNWQSTAAVWRNGDFNYDGQVTISDLGDLASNWQAGVGSPLGMSFQEALAAVGFDGAAVPEPTSLAMLGLVGAMSLRRRR